jgi:hypothetical protein
VVGRPRVRESREERKETRSSEKRVRQELFLQLQELSLMRRLFCSALARLGDGGSAVCVAEAW